MAPSRRDIAGRTLAWLLPLAALASVSVLQGLHNALRASQDFQYSPTRVLMRGADPYLTWLHGNPGGVIILSQQPNYAHALYLLLMPLAALPWPVAKLAWAALNLASAVTVTLLMGGRPDASPVRTAALLCIFLASTPFRVAIGNGQQALIVLVCLYAAWRSARPAGASTILAALGFAIGFSKYSFLPPYAHGLLLAKRTRLLVWALAALAAGWMIFSFLVGRPPAATLLEPVKVGSSAVGFGTADIMSLSRSLRADAEVFPGSSAACGLACSILLCTLCRQSLVHGDRLESFAITGLVSLVSFVHLSYDFVFLLPTLMLLPSLPRAPRLITAAGLTYFWFGLKLIDMTLKPAPGPVPILINWLAGLGLLLVLDRAVACRISTVSANPPGP
ncbi:MAG TPA: glycosyltransferase 87 family protein [Steroidobacteraceae bacterium]|nr:glycosyltransferase 87 family protein [Steroidobacteraceae bacterium]